MSFLTVALLLALLNPAGAPRTESGALQNKNAQTPNATTSAAKTTLRLQLMTDPQGADFSSYMRSVYQAVKQRWLSNMLPSVDKGQQGVNSFMFNVVQDGNVQKDSFKMIFGSGRSDFDSASARAIHDAAPFEHLPENFSKPSVTLRLTFYYNTPSDKP